MMMGVAILIVRGGCGLIDKISGSERLQWAGSENLRCRF